MARRNKSSSSGGGANWMDTYGDMVTLLLTFFVMLYASSSFDEQKWQYILQAFQSKGAYANTIVAPENPDSTDDPYVTDEIKDGDLPETFDQLYQYLVNYVDKNGLKDSVEVDKGQSNVYLKFKDQVFFSGDSDVLLKTGKDILNALGAGISAVDDKIMIVKVCGHTAISPTSVKDDTFLSTGRASNVANYLRDNKIVSAKKIVATGYGPNRPIAPNDTEENRAKNRRVEIVIIRNDADFSNEDVIKELLELDFGTEVILPEEAPKN